MEIVLWGGGGPAYHTGDDLARPNMTWALHPTGVADRGSRGTSTSLFSSWLSQSRSLAWTQQDDEPHGREQLCLLAHVPNGAARNV